VSTFQLVDKKACYQRPYPTFAGIETAEDLIGDLQQTLG
jgi:hypothetical protein